ncbi:hypothetical protein CRG98_015104 [Punica granatum]|uniref:Uncharacterized protein n=1 Tax=Punica granatum TaxID=22663 RepID=A0A2I0K7L3_PUNGR|nr:hypothetical protein CRG98_015104 [Punica granatum]
MSYLASGYEERVGEVFESRVTRLNAWKDAWVQRRPVQGARCTGSAAGVHRRRTGARADTRLCAWGVRGRSGWRTAGTRLWSLRGFLEGECLERVCKRRSHYLNHFWAIYRQN